MEYKRSSFISKRAELSKGVSLSQTNSSLYEKVTLKSWKKYYFKHSSLYSYLE